MQALLYTNDQPGSAISQAIAAEADRVGVQLLVAQSFDTGQTAPTPNMRVRCFLPMLVLNLGVAANRAR